MAKINAEMRAEGELCDEIKMLQVDSEKEARSVEEFVREEIEEEIGLRRSMKRRYRNVMRNLMRMLLRSAEVRTNYELRHIDKLI